MPSNYDRLFEELGMLEEEQEANPFEVLGFSPELGRELLSQDRSGKHIQIAVGGLYRALTRLYHEESGELPDRERFEALARARAQIEEASPAALSRWLRPERTAQASSGQTKRFKAEQRELLSRSGELLERSMALGRHPLHFARLELSQGVMLQRGNGMLLVRQRPEGGIRVQPGYQPHSTKSDLTWDLSLEAAHFKQFMNKHKSFGLKPGTRIAAYIDEAGRASLLGADLSFIMDITEPVDKVRQDYLSMSRMRRKNDAASYAWARSPHPLLFITDVPSGEVPITPSAQSVVFPGTRGELENVSSTTWDLPHEIAGSLGDHTFYRRMRNSRVAGAMALEGGRSGAGANYFNLLNVPSNQLIAQEARYTPLMEGDNGFLLFDPEHNMPVVTDARIVGVIGSNSGAA